MRHTILALVLALGPAAMAHELVDELDGEQAVPAEKIEKLKDLPQTTIVQTSKTDSSKIAVFHLKEHLAAGKVLSALKFEKLAANTEVVGIAYGYDSKTELDATPSTPAWRFAVGVGVGGGYRGGYGGGYGYRGVGVGYRGYAGGYGGTYGYNGGNYSGYGYATTYPSYGYGYRGGYGYSSGCGGYSGGCGGGCGGYYSGGCGYSSSYYYPNYVYAGYNYNCDPYWGPDANYNYTYYSPRY